MGENNNNQSEMYGARQCGDAVPPFFGISGTAAKVAISILRRAHSTQKYK
jgi:hypothetical protein